MGKVKDIYMHYVDSGDQFVGRCLSLLLLLSSNFASLPPYFPDTATDDGKNRLEALCLSQFLMVACLPNYGLLTWMCLATVLYHHNWILENFMVNHVVCCVSTVLHQVDVVQHCDTNPGFVIVTCPWNDNAGHVFTDVPPYVAMLQELTLL